jgi:uncharacterized BrkB/YihY/UPF0761 family membrane protein
VDVSESADAGLSIDELSAPATFSLLFAFFPLLSVAVGGVAFVIVEEA